MTEQRAGGLDPWIITDIKKRQEQEKDRQKREQPRVNIDDFPFRTPEDDEADEKRRREREGQRGVDSWQM